MLEEFMQKVLEKLDKQEKISEKILLKLEEHDRKFEIIDKKFENVDRQFTDVNSQFREIKNYLIIIEDKISNEIPALFDGYNANFEKNVNLESRQDITEQKVSINSLRISSLEDTSEIHSKQISKLLAQ